VNGIAIERVFTITQTNSTNVATITNIEPLDLEDEVLFRNYDTKDVRNEWPLNIKVNSLKHDTQVACSLQVFQ